MERLGGAEVLYDAISRQTILDDRLNALQRDFGRQQVELSRDEAVNRAREGEQRFPQNETTTCARGHGLNRSLGANRRRVTASAPAGARKSSEAPLRSTRV
jgi:hypothetical protein